jgi:hypothetical protein
MHTVYVVTVHDQLTNENPQVEEDLEEIVRQHGILHLQVHYRNNSARLF